MANAGVPEGDAYNIKNETDSDNGIPLYDIEFETDYGDYDFEVAMADGRIVGADYEVDEEWLDALGGSPVTAEEAASIVAGKIPGASAADVDIWEESGDGRGRYEGELFLDGMKYEFEIDPQTGRNLRLERRSAGLMPTACCNMRIWLQVPETGICPAETPEYYTVQGKTGKGVSYMSIREALIHMFTDDPVNWLKWALVLPS